jgi:hypothetical protein
MVHLYYFINGFHDDIGPVTTSILLQRIYNSVTPYIIFEK